MHNNSKFIPITNRLQTNYLQNIRGNPFPRKIHRLPQTRIYRILRPQLTNQGAIKQILGSQILEHADDAALIERQIAHRHVVHDGGRGPDHEHRLLQRLIRAVRQLLRQLHAQGGLFRHVVRRHFLVVFRRFAPLFGGNRVAAFAARIAQVVLVHFRVESARRVAAYRHATHVGRFLPRPEMPRPIIGVFARFAAHRALPRVWKIFVDVARVMGAQTLNARRMRYLVTNLECNTIMGNLPFRQQVIL